MKNGEQGLRVTVVTDGRPGHEKQSLGLVRGLKNRLAVQMAMVSVADFGLPRQIGVQFARFLPPWACWLDFLDNGATDLVICTGSRTHALALTIKKRLGIPAVTCMTPDFLYRCFFDICFVPEHDGPVSGSNIFVTVGAPNTLFDKKKHDSAKGLILLGGKDSKTHIWDQERLVSQILQIIEKETDIFWSLSSSPRTPAATCELLTKMVKSYANVAFFDYRSTEKGWIERQYHLCRNVWVTADSVSMVYEALSAGCQVNILPVDWLAGGAKLEKNERLLLEKNLVRPFALWQSGKNISDNLQTINEAQRCADYIIEKWWPKNIR